MKNFLRLTTAFILLIFLGGNAWGQGLENFDNLTVGSTYSTGNFVGEDGITWNYVASRDDDGTSGITHPALMLRKSSVYSKVYSGTIAGGIGTFSVKLYKGFTGSGNRQVELFINGVSKGTSTPFDDYDEHIFTLDNIDISGDIIIRIDNITAKQVIVDDITWTAYAAGPTITLSETALSSFSYIVGNGPSAEQTFTAAGTNLDADISIAATTNYEISKTSGTGYTTPLTLTQSAGTVNATTIYVRLKAGLDVGDYNSQNITATSTDATTKTVTCSGSVASPSNPGSFSATTVSSSQINLSWTENAATDEVMVVYDLDGSFTDPVDGIEYSGTALGGTVIYKGSAEEYSHTSLSADEQYFYKAWSVDASDNYSSGVTDDATTYQTEPTNHVTGFAATANSYSEITNTWTDAVVGTQAASGYLLLANTSGTFQDPVDGTLQNDDTNLGDGSGVVNLGTGASPYQWSGLTAEIRYYFKIFSFNGSGTQINYKTDGTVPTADATTDEYIAPKLFISEVTDPHDHYEGRFVELYNSGTTDIDFSTDTWYLSIQSNGGSFSDDQLTGIIQAGGVFVTSYLSINFNTYFGFDSDQNTGFAGNGDDGYFLYKDGNHLTGTLVDAYGVIDQDGSGEPWEYENSKAVRKTTVTAPITLWTASEWDITSADVADCDPGTYKDFMTWVGSGTTDWATPGNWMGGTIPNLTKSIKIPFGASNDPIISGNAICNSLSIVDGATLTIESNVSGTGSLIVNGTSTGSVTLQRYIVGSSDDWHFLSSPVTTQEISGNFTDANGYDFYLYDEPTNIWSNRQNLAAGNSGDLPYFDVANGDINFTPGRGYLVAYTNPNTNAKSFTGSLNQNTVSIPVTKSGTDDRVGSNLLGNPFPSSIDWKAATGWTRDMLVDDDISGEVGYTMYIWNEAASNYGTFISNGSSGTNSVTQYIPPMQGFFVVANSSGSVQMTEDICVHDGADNWLKNNSNEGILGIKVSSDNFGYDEAIIEFSDNKTGGAKKWNSLVNSAPSIWVESNNDDYSILFASNENNSIPVSFVAGESDIYHLNIQNELEGIENLILEDKELNIYQDLLESNEYSFLGSPDQNPNRFIIHFSPLGTEEITEVNNIKIWSANNTVSIINNQNLVGDISIVNLFGQVIANYNLTGDTKQQVDITATAGLYIVSVKADNGLTSTKKVYIK